MAKAKFSVGQLVQHKLFGYRGVVVDADATFQLDDEWYRAMAKSKPPREQPWYHVLVHNATHVTYVAECNLGPDENDTPIIHPLVKEYFLEFRDGHYTRKTALN